ncbi:MAG: hypothetical protein KJ060_12650 [Candidatus Hydrogenedentes bacterium]|nr:hypothetical protein [Candidatus Hydrogenedentota bacterium]
MDGLVFARHHVIVAIGAGVTGKKHVLGIVEGARPAGPFVRGQKKPEMRTGIGRIPDARVVATPARRLGRSGQHTGA